MAKPAPALLPPHANYRELLSYQKAEVVYDLTYRFCERFMLGNRSHTRYETYRTYADSGSAEVVANIALCLIHQANYLLDQQIRRLEQDFLREGGIRERMTRARPQARAQRAI